MSFTIFLFLSLTNDQDLQPKLIALVKSPCGLIDKPPAPYPFCHFIYFSYLHAEDQTSILRKENIVQIFNSQRWFLFGANSSMVALDPHCHVHVSVLFISQGLPRLRSHSIPPNVNADELCPPAHYHVLKGKPRLYLPNLLS